MKCARSMRFSLISLLFTVAIQVLLLIAAKQEVGGSIMAEAAVVPSANLNAHEWVERLRYEVRQQQPRDDVDENASTMTAILPDAPFIQLRHSAANDPIRSISSNSSAAEPHVVHLRPGQTAVVLQCEVLGMPSPVAYWTKDGGPIAANPAAANAIEVETNSGRPTLEHAVTVAKVRIPCVTRANAGLYQCTGDNGVEKVSAYTKVVVLDGGENGGGGSTACLSQQQQDTVSAEEEQLQANTNQVVRAGAMAPANIYMYTEMRLEYPGNDAQLVCRADGKPRPSVRWFDSDNRPIKNGQNFTLLENGDLLVKRINFGAREPFRQFRCHADNPIGNDVAAVDLLSIARSK